jgi:hypothetical protein
VYSTLTCLSIPYYFEIVVKLEPTSVHGWSKQIGKDSRSVSSSSSFKRARRLCNVSLEMSNIPGSPCRVKQNVELLIASGANDEHQDSAHKNKVMQ